MFNHYSAIVLASARAVVFATQLRLNRSLSKPLIYQRFWPSFELRRLQLSSSRTRVTPPNPVLNKPVTFAAMGSLNILFGVEMNSLQQPVNNGIQCQAQGLCEQMMTNKAGMVELHKGLMHVAMIMAQKIAETSKEQADPPPLVQPASIAEVPNLHMVRE
jgi:hypothetical protein